jgi:hypothetical protein
MWTNVTSDSKRVTDYLFRRVTYVHAHLPATGL